MTAQDPKRLEAHLRDLAQRAVRRWEAADTLFLDPSEQILAEAAAREAGAAWRFYGGYDDAERKVCKFFLQDAPNDETNWPFCVIIIRWNPKFGTIGHRDLLGSLMSLGFERSVFGDILPGKDGEALLFVHRTVADTVAFELDRVGRVSVTADLAEIGEVAVPEPDWVAGDTVIASLRLDALAAAAFHTSRSEVQEACRKGLIKLNHLPEVRPDVRVREGDLLSFRGHGRARLDSVVGTTKKDRIHIKISYTK